MIRRIGFVPLLILLAAVSLTLRLIGLDWDQGQYLHPDERFVVWVTSDLRWPATIGEFFNTATSPLNPYNTRHDSFVYGTFPSFLVKAIATPFGMDIYGELHLVGRAVNAVLDTGTVVLTAWLGKRFFDARAGLLAGFLLAFTPLFLQLAHFFTVDTIATFFAVAAFACMIRSCDRNSIGWLAIAGVMIGLAAASKPNLLVTVAFLGLPVLEQVRRGGWRSLLPRLHEHVYPALPAAFTGGFVAFWTFRLGMPYAFAGPNWWNISLNQRWLDDLAFWRAVQTGLVDMKPSIQWIDRTPVVYILQNMVLWGMGSLLGIAAVAAMALAAWRILRSPRWPSWWWIGIVGWCIANIALYGTGIAQNQRYLMQVYPFLILLAAGMLIELQRRLEHQWIANLLLTAVIIYTAIYGAAFDSLYVRPLTRIEASAWIYDNIPAGSVISNEYWDDALPLPMAGEDRSAYTGMTLDLYGDESQDSAKVTTLVGQLSQVDYIVLSSNRVIDSVVRQPERYPVAVRYYEMLISGELGFEPIADFTRGPEILGIEWDDRSAEESLTVYEHPQVRIFIKTDAYSAQQVFNELNAAWGYGGVHSIPGDPAPAQMLMSDADIATNIVADTGDRFELPRKYPVLFWWATMQIVALAAWPITWRAFRNLPDTGWILAKGIGLLGTAALTLTLVRWGPFDFAAGTVAIAILLLLSLGLATERCVWSRFRHDLGRKWRHILIGEAVFTAIFAGVALLRMHQAMLPDHNLMMLSGTLRSATLPPLDPWLSGGVLHTHWAGILPWAAIGKLLTLDPVVAYNLTIVGIAATLAGVVWSLVASLTRSWIAVLAAIVVVWGSTGAFIGGIAPRIAGISTDLPTLAMLLIAAILLHCLVSRDDARLLPIGVTALAAGAMTVAVGWGIIAAAAIVAIGLAIPAWQCRDSVDPWWPIVRRFVIRLIAIIAAGIALWYPAFASYTATQRGLIPPASWSLNLLGDELGLVLVLLVLVVAVGAAHVLALTLNEGKPGIVTSGIALVALITFVGLGWRYDSALMVIMLMSLLAIIAAWHWLDTTAMVWSIGSIFLGIGVLLAAQTRPFHLTPGGTSAADQLVPLAWLLFIVAIAIAGGYYAGRLSRHARLALGFAAIMVTIALVIPTASHLQRDEWGIARTSLAEPTVLLSPGELQAASWIRDEITGMPVILTASGGGNVGAISAVAGQPTVLGDSEVERRMRPGWEDMVEARRLDVTTIYTQSGQWATVAPLLQQYDVGYIVIGSAERAMFGSTIEQLFAIAAQNGHLELVYQAEGVTIYRVIPLED